MLRDPIENTPEYETAMQTIQPQLDKEFPPESSGLGTCHRFWHRKKELLQAKGIAWQSPAELNPHIRFD